MILLILFLVGVVIVAYRSLFGLGHRVWWTCVPDPCFITVEYVQSYCFFVDNKRRLSKMDTTSRIICFAALLGCVSALCEYFSYVFLAVNSFLWGKENQHLIKLWICFTVVAVYVLSIAWWFSSQYCKIAWSSNPSSGIGSESWNWFIIETMKQNYYKY